MKILLLDIESAPNLSYVWDHYDVNVIKHVREWYVLCVAHMWLEEKQASCVALPDFNFDEAEMLAAIWQLLDEADVVIGHNGDRFDIRKLNARFVKHGFTPPSPFQTVDTLKVARSVFKFNQNGLDPLSVHLDIGTKAKHEGFSLWERCMVEDPVDEVAWRKMIRYAKKDVVLLKELYLRLRPWMKTHPNMLLLEGGHGCPKCGSLKMQRRGFAHTRTLTYQQWWCTSCGAWSRSRFIEDTKKPELV